MFVRAQLRICRFLVQRRKAYDKSVVLATPFILPVLLSRALGKAVCLHIDGKPDSWLARFTSRVNFALATSLMTEAWALLDFWKIRSRSKANKCTPYVDPLLFTRKKPLESRKQVVGFLGGFDKGKGINEMLQAVRLLNQKGEDLEYIIGGSGQLENLVRRLSRECTNVDFRGQIPWTRVPDTLNECRVIVVPSYSEGLPNIMLEAMACGTPVLVTPVGGIPDVVVDGETGFILPNNSPESIAKHVLRVLNDPALSQVVENAYRLVMTEFSFSASVRRYSVAICAPEGKILE